MNVHERGTWQLCHIKRLAFPFNISFYFYATHATLEVYISYTGDKEDTDKNRNFENFVHKFKASPGHPTGSFTWGKWGILLTRFGDWVEYTSVAQVEVSRGLLLFVSVSCLAFIFKFVHDLLITVQCFHPFSKHAISMSASISEFQKTCLRKFSGLVMFLDISSTILWRCNLKSPQNGNLKTRIIRIDRFIYLLCLKCVLIKATCEREIIKLGHKIQRIWFL